MWFRNDMEYKAKKARKVMNILGIEKTSQNQIMEAIAMEILAAEFTMQDKYQKAAFVKSQGDVLGDVRQMLLDEGVLTRGNKKCSPKDKET